MENNPYKVVFEGLASAGINYLIVGGVAVNLYGYQRFTGDVDILLSLDDENLIKMEGLMERLGYIKRLPVDLTSLKDNEQVEKWLEEKGMTAYTFLSEQGVKLDIDILTSKSLDFDQYQKRSNVVEVWNMKLPVVSFDDLIDMKREANRDKDLLDIKGLLESKEL